MELVADRFQRRLGGKGQRMPLKSDRHTTSHGTADRSASVSSKPVAILELAR